MTNLMKCPKCKTAKNGKNYCDECGTKLESFADEKGVWKPNGLWRVTTQGDEEGKTTKQLGVHEGHIADIAYLLSGSVCYDLHFSPIQTTVEASLGKPRDSVHITLDIDSGTTQMEKEARQAYFRTMIKDRPDVKVTESNYYGAVVFNFNKEGKK